MNKSIECTTKGCTNIGVQFFYFHFNPGRLVVDCSYHILNLKMYLNSDSYAELCLEEALCHQVLNV